MKIKLFFSIFFFISLLFSIQTKAQITPSNNIIGVDITLPQNSSYTYDSAFTSCYNLGMRQIGLHFLWKSSLETSPKTYNFSYLDIANIYYPALNVPVDLNIDPIETNVLELPTDISSYAFDDTIVINRFKTLLDSVFNHIPNLQLSSLVIGSEVDAYLGTDATKWAQYTTFYSTVSAYAKTLRAGLKVSCEAMLSGITGSASSYLQTLNNYSDIIGVSYYPLNANFTVKPTSIVETDFTSVINLYSSKPIYYYQLGYPSSSACNSSETQQAQFITQVFQSWDTHAANIKMIDFTWLHDWSAASVSYWSSYYGISDPAFLGFLGSIGLRNGNANGSDKKAFTELKCQAKQRAYNNLTINCSTGLDELSNTASDFNLFPNPNNGNFQITLNAINKVEIKIINIVGKIVFHKTISNQESTEINVSELEAGIYFISATTNTNTYYNKKIIIVH